MKTKAYYYTLETYRDLFESQSELDINCLYRIIDRLSSIYVDENGFVEISHKSLESIVSRYSKYIYFLLANNIIDVNESYKVNDRCKKYRLRYVKSDVSKIEVTNVKTLQTILKERKSLENQLYYMTEKTEQWKKMKSYFKEFLKELDIDEAISDCKAIYDVRQRILQYKFLDKIKNGEIYFRRNKTNNRLDTNLTNLISNIKYYNSNDYIQIDISNSQLYFLYLFIYEYIQSIKHSTILCSKNQCNPYVNQLFTVTEFEYIFKYSIDETELDRFGKTVCSGMFYDEFANNQEISREEAKKIVFAILFSKNESYPKQKVIFKNSYPTIYQFIHNFKEVYQYNKLAILLQKIESNKVLDDICLKLCQKDIFNVTIHDSWIIRKSDYFDAYKTITEAFNLMPNFKIDVFDLVRVKKKEQLKERYNDKGSKR